MAVAGLLVSAGICLVVRSQSTTVHGPESWPVGALPKHAYKTGRGGFDAVVSFQHPLTPTADPLVFHYHPGHPPAVVPATYEVRFAAPPDFPPSPPYVVRGRVSHVEPDLVRRVNGVPGRLVLLAAVPVPP